MIHELGHVTHNEILIGGGGGHSYGMEWLSVCISENFE